MAAGGPCVLSQGLHLRHPDHWVSTGGASIASPSAEDHVTGEILGYEATYLGQARVATEAGVVSPGGASRRSAEARRCRATWWSPQLGGRSARAAASLPAGRPELPGYVPMRRIPGVRSVCPSTTVSRAPGAADAGPQRRQARRHRRSAVQLHRNRGQSGVPWGQRRSGPALYVLPEQRYGLVFVFRVFEAGGLRPRDGEQRAAPWRTASRRPLTGTRCVGEHPATAWLRLTLTRVWGQRSSVSCWPPSGPPEACGLLQRPRQRGGWPGGTPAAGARCVRCGGQALAWLDEPGWPRCPRWVTLPIPQPAGDRSHLPVCKGDVALLKRQGVMVGARFRQERQCTEAAAAVLSRASLVVVSGLALGIDAAAHRGGLAQGGADGLP